jgi:putative DNA primase/helicase
MIERLSKSLVMLARKNRPTMFTAEDGGVNMALFSHSGISRWIAAGLGKLLIWTDPVGWRIYDEVAGAYIQDFAEAVLNRVLREYQGALLNVIPCVKNQADQQAAFRFYQKFLDYPCLRAVGDLLRYEPGVYHLPSDFDTNDNIINCGGVAVSVTGEQRPAGPEDRFTVSAAARPESGSPTEFLRFLKWASCDDAELEKWLLTACGIAIFGHPTDRIINLYGHGSNGKGTLLRTLFKVLGDYAVTLPRSLVIKEPGGGSRFDKELLPGKRAAILFDLKADKGKLNLDELKSIAGNGDLVYVEPKGKKGFSARLKCKIFIASNDKICIDAFGESEKRRFYLVPFNAHVEVKDETIEDRFVPEYGKILNLFIEYAVKYFQNGRKMPPCMAIDRATADYFDSQDLVGQFISDNCVIDKMAMVSKTEIYDKFALWCEDEHGIKQPMKSKSFSGALEKRGIYESRQRFQGKITRVFMGIKIDLLTVLTKNPEFRVSPLENPSREDRVEIQESLSTASTKPEKTGPPGSDPGPFSSPEQRKLWENPETVLY